jgi:hypothetical protein
LTRERRSTVDAYRGLAWAAVVWVAWAPGTAAGDDRESIHKALVNVVEGKAKLAPLSVTYDDMHGLWGGLRLMIRGDGTVEQKAVRVPAGKPKSVAPADVKRLVSLIVELKAWEQREKERLPRPDENRARLVITYSGRSSEIWEWHNDLEKNRRIARVQTMMKDIAWEAP